MSKRSTRKATDFASKAEYRAWLKRSKAAKKGWVTKHLKTLPKKISEAEKRAAQIRKVIKKPRAAKKPKHKTKKKKPKTRHDEAAQLKRELKEARETIAELQLLASFVHAFPPEMRRYNGTVAKEWCSLRALPNKQELFEVLLYAESKGPNELRRIANAISKKYDVPLREVYTLLESP